MGVLQAITSGWCFVSRCRQATSQRLLLEAPAIVRQLVVLPCLYVARRTLGPGDNQTSYAQVQVQSESQSCPSACAS